MLTDVFAAEVLRKLLEEHDHALDDDAVQDGLGAAAGQDTLVALQQLLEEVTYLHFQGLLLGVDQVRHKIAQEWELLLHLVLA